MVIILGLISSLFSFAENRSNIKSSIVSCSHSANYVILDIETTGLSPSKDDIIQLSAIQYDTTGSPICCFNSYINPLVPISDRISEITGITNNDLRNAPTAGQIEEEFLAFIGENLLVGYNVTFDLRFLNNAFHGVFHGRKYVDVLPMARNHFFTPDYKLETVAIDCGFCPKCFHNSLTDCEAVAAVLHRINQPLDYWVHTFNGAGNNYKFSKKEFRVTPRFFSVEDLEKENKHLFFMKNIVFTGDMHMSRQEAAQLATDVGGIVKTSVSSKTHYLVVGKQDLALVGQDGMSTKEEKAQALNQSGKAHIKVISEHEFLALLYQGQEV